MESGYHAYLLADLFPENQAFLDWAKPELDRIGSLQAAYQPVQIDMEIVASYIGDYALPVELGLPYPYYSIAFENGSLTLKIKPDKAWLELSPLSETSFYHVSSFSQFEVTFLPGEDGQVDQFQYQENGETFTFTRIKDPVAEPVTSTPDPPTPSPSAAVTELPTSPAQPTATPSATLLNTKTPHVVQSTALPTNGKSASNSTWWAIPTLALIMLAGWILIRTIKK